MTALKKRAKKKGSKAAKKAAQPRVIKMTIDPSGSFSPDPLNLKPGNLLKIVGPGTNDVDIEVSITVSGGGGGGGPVTIHS
jgi:hypothetical protein